MDRQKFLESLEGVLTPTVYPRCLVDEPGGIHRLFVRGGPLPFVGRYALAVADWSAGLSPRDQLDDLRRAVRRSLGALWGVREVGLHALWLGRRADWEGAARELAPDRTGLRAVIVQGVHFVDLATATQEVRQSAWGPVRFGLAGGIERVVAAILEAAV